MRYIPEDGRIVWSASDLKAAAECEFAWLRAIDARLDRVPPVEEPVDLTLERAGRLGIAHEKRVLARLPRRVRRRRRRDPRGKVVGCRGPRRCGGAAPPRHSTSDADVIYQAAFSTRDFVGFADFLVRD